MYKKWTIMIYLAGDNNLESFGQRDLLEVKAVGSTEAINIVAQFDRMSDHITRRYYLSRDRPLSADVVAELSETNTGDPATLLDFIRWGLAEYPAEHTALILWNHGAGWKDDDIYALARQAGLVDSDVLPSLVRNVNRQRIGRSLFATSIQTILQYPGSTRAILFDDTSKDFLDNHELKQILDDILAYTQGQKIDLIGFDACLMNMVEVAAQIQHACQYMVGSQEIEPGDGWPYDRILSRLAVQPDVPAETFGQIVVEAYAHYYSQSPSSFPVTQSAICLQHIPTLVDSIGRLADKLIEQLPDPVFFGRVLMPTLRRVQKFHDRQYVDLGHFGQLIAERAGDGPIGQIAGEMMAQLNAAAARSVAAATAGPKSNAESERDVRPGRKQDTIITSGLSIYLPLFGAISPAYAELEFSQHCNWVKFLDAFLET